MALVLQYAGHRKDKGGRYLVRFAIWPEEQPIPKHTVEVDATEMISLQEIEAAAFGQMTVADDGHFLEDNVKDAIQEGRQVMQPAAQVEHIERLRERANKVGRGKTANAPADTEPDERLIGQ